jgi:DNA-binding MarR family transcriptional regulator
MPAPLRLVRLEHLRTLDTLLVRLARPGAAPSLVARLGGEPGGPPLAGAAHRLAGLADAWLVDPAASAGLLLRWDDGDRYEAVERRWLAALTDLLPVTPPVAIVCATPAVRQRWLDRLAGRDHLPPLWLTVADDLAATGDVHPPRIWRDERGGPAPPPALTRLPAALLAMSDPPVPDRWTAVLAARRLTLGATGLAALRAIARRPLATTADLAFHLACSPSLAYRRVDALAAARLVRRLAPDEGTPGGNGGRVTERSRSLWVTRAGVRLLAAASGQTPAQFRTTTPLAGGAVGRPGRPHGSRTLGRLARHRQHTLDLIRLQAHLQAAVHAARQAGRAIELLDWQGPVTRPVRFPTDDPSLARRPPAWALPRRSGAAGPIANARPFGQVEPDAIARLRLGEDGLTLLIEWDRGSEGRCRLARKLRHYVGWGGSPAAAGALALVITTTPEREALMHALVTDLARRRAETTPPLWTTTITRLVEDGALAAIWWAPGARVRQALCVNVIAAHASYG